MICAKLMPAVSGFEQEFPERVKSENVDATAGDAPTRIKELGFESHGIVITSADGRVLWKQKDHEVKIEDARAELRRLLAG